MQIRDEETNEVMKQKNIGEQRQRETEEDMREKLKGEVKTSRVADVLKSERRGLRKGSLPPESAFTTSYTIACHPARECTRHCTLKKLMPYLARLPR